MRRTRFSFFLSYFLPRFQDTLFIALFAGVVGLGPRLLNVDGDLGRHLTIGEYILQSGKIPARDLFSFTMSGQPLVPHEWLAEVLFALAYRLSGLDGVVFLCALLIAAAFSLCYRQCLAHSGMVLVALGWAVLAAAAASLHWLARPHLFTLLLTILWAGQLEGLRRGAHSRWWIFPALMLLWANLHGAFIAGFVLWGLYLVGEIWEGRSNLHSLRLLALAGGASFLASWINPSGWALWETSLGYLGNHYLVTHTAEYFSPDFHQVSTWPFLLSVMISLLFIGSRGFRWSAASVFSLAAWTAMGLVSVRNIPLYALVTSPILADGSAILLRSSGLLSRFQRLNDRLAEVEVSLRGTFWPAVVVILFSLLLSGGTQAGGIRLDFSRQGNRFDPAVFPVAAVDWLQTRPPRRLFNHFPWGGYLLHRSWPEQQVFIDGQTDFYGETLTRQYEQVISMGDGWLEVLKEYRVDGALLPVDSKLVQVLEDDPAWRVVYQDETAAILFAEQ